MNIWTFYEMAQYRSTYIRLLRAKGIKAGEADIINHKLSVYVQRIKDTHITTELSKIVDYVAFHNALSNLFYVRWANHIDKSYQDVPGHFLEMLRFIPVIEAARGEYINEEEKASIENTNFAFPATELTDLEKEFVINGKLRALVNPPFMAYLKHQMDNGKTLNDIIRSCKVYYSILLPNMTPTDYAFIVKETWTVQKNARNGAGRFHIKVTFPDGKQQYNSLDGLKAVIAFYGADKVMAKKLKLKDQPLLKTDTMGTPGRDYEQICEGYYINTLGNNKTRFSMLLLLNAMFGRKLIIEYGK